MKRNVPTFRHETLPCLLHAARRIVGLVVVLTHGFRAWVSSFHEQFLTSAGTSADMESQTHEVSARPRRSAPAPASPIVASAPVPSAAAIPATVVGRIAIIATVVGRIAIIAPSVSGVATITAPVSSVPRHGTGRHHGSQSHNRQNQRTNHQRFLYNSPPLYTIQVLLGVDINALSQDRSVLLRREDYQIHRGKNSPNMTQFSTHRLFLRIIGTPTPLLIVRCFQTT